MLFPIRCWTCNCPIAQLYRNYIIKTNANGLHANEVMNSMKINRYCCRRMFITHPQMLADEVSYFRDARTLSLDHNNVKFPSEKVSKRTYDIDHMYAGTNIVHVVP